MQFTLDRDAGIPLYRQIVNQVRDQIRSGAAPPGHRLPPVRTVAAQYGVTRLTVHNAYSELQAQGLVESHIGRGTYVAVGASPSQETATRARAPEQWVSQGVLAELLRVGELRDVTSFAQAFPAPETYPARAFGWALQHVLRDPSALNYGPIQGEPELREQIADLLQDRGFAVSPEHMLIISGAQQGCDLALRALVEPGDVVLAEEPTYPGMLELAALRGQRVVGIHGDTGGMRLDALEAACIAYRPRALYLIPTYNNPTGRSLATDRRAAVLRLAREHAMLVIEDDTYGFLGLEHDTPPPLIRDDGDHVVYITSFSKVLAPALRLGVLVASPSLLPGLAAVKQSSDLVCSALLQRALAEYLRKGHFAPHLQHVRRLYRERRDAMLAALQEHAPQCMWTHPDGGLSLWVQLPDGIDEPRFTADALEHGVGVAPGRAFYSQPQHPAAMRLSFGAHTPDQIEQGIATLGHLIESHVHRRFAMLSLAGRGSGPLV